MPVRKFRGPEEMEAVLWRPPGHPDLLRAIASVWSFARTTCPRRFPPGVYRHRTIEEAQNLRERWERENFEALWARPERRNLVVRPDQNTGRAPTPSRRD